MSILVVGSVAFDIPSRAFGQRGEEVLGGAATYFGSVRELLHGCARGSCGR